MPYFYSSKYLLETNAIINAMKISNSLLYEYNSEKNISNRGATSCILGMISENILSLGSVGNCIALLYRKSNLSLISTPDCLNPIGQEYAHGNFPLVTIGMYEDLEPKVWETNLLPGDKIILSTDGAYLKHSLEEIKFYIEKNKEDDFGLVNFLMNEANDKGNVDNQSVISISL